MNSSNDTPSAQALNRAREELAAIGWVRWACWAFDYGRALVLGSLGAFVTLPCAIFWLWISGTAPLDGSLIWGDGTPHTLTVLGWAWCAATLAVAAWSLAHWGVGRCFEVLVVQYARQTDPTGQQEPQ